MLVFPQNLSLQKQRDYKLLALALNVVLYQNIIMVFERIINNMRIG